MFARVAKSLPSTHFVIAGDGPELDEVRRAAKRAGIAKQLHFPGFVVKPALPFSIFDLYITVSVGETTGIAALEAAMFGLPVIAVQLRKDYSHGATDWIFSSSESDALGARAVHALELPDRPRIDRRDAKTFMCGSISASTRWLVHIGSSMKLHDSRTQARAC